MLAVLGRSVGASPESDELFRNGRDLLKAGKIPEACEAFAHSEKLEPRVGTLLNLADCRERQGQTATAWKLFVEARDLAASTEDRRQNEAEKRAAAIKSKLAYITIAVAPERQIDGLVIKRNGLAVDRAQWSTPVPQDPGDYIFEAAAPRFKPWSARQTLGVTGDLTVEIPALEAEPREDVAATVTPAIAHDIERPIAIAPIARAEPVRPFGVGLMLGTTGDSDTVAGARISGGLAVPQGAVRAIGSLLYASYADNMADPTSSTSLYALGLSTDYVWMPIPHVAFAGGLGIGIDVLARNLGRPGDTNAWWTVRASPLIVRLAGGHVEAGLHLQYVRTGDRGVMIGVAAIDLFPL
ncbi:MAG: hypothetical protein JWO36_6671 [Myxococcales bacterium]|nr:hypothetical protein [Myxococcales bacterium]